MTVNTRKSISLAKVVWIGGGTVQEIMTSKPFGVAQAYVNANRSNPQYAGGVLKAVSNSLRKENIIHAFAAGNLKR
jgi:hypothetical protein